MDQNQPGKTDPFVVLSNVLVHGDMQTAGFLFC